MFSHESEEVRSAAAFAAGMTFLFLFLFPKIKLKVHLGNIAIGNMHHFLPSVINLVQLQNEKRLLALYALKEVGFIPTLFLPD